MTNPEPIRPMWKVPGRYGYSGAIDGLGSIAAPLLAAASVMLLGLVLTLGSSLRWSNAALPLLVASSFAFVACVQFTVWARQFIVTTSQIAEWWPSGPAIDDPELRWEQRFHDARFSVWAKRSRWAYNLGILCLLAALPVMLAPRARLSDIEPVRLAAIALASAALVAEAVWIGLIDPPEWSLLSRRLLTKDCHS